MKQRDIMVDIETIGRPPNGGVIAIGAVAFNPAAPITDQPWTNVFELQFDPHDVVRTGGEIDIGTILWWMQQDQEVRRTMFAGNVGVVDGLRRFIAWYKEQKGERVWANGTTFDIVLLDAMFKRSKLSSPWHYRDVRDMRIFRDIANLEYVNNVMNLYNANTKAHDALADAVTQAKTVVEANKVINLFSQQRG